MIVEIAVAVLFVECVKAKIWNEKDWNQYKAKNDLLRKNLNELKTVEEALRKTEEQRKDRPDLYTPIPEPLLIKIMLRIRPGLRIQKWEKE